MTALQSLKKKLDPLGIYNMSEGTSVCAELAAYAFAIDKHRENMETVLREGFISTSESYGLELRERVFGNVRGDYTIEQRREMLRLRRGFGNSDFTLAGFDKFMTGLGVGNYNVTELCGAYTVAVTLSKTFNNTDAKWIENQIKLFVPAHLLAYVYYGGPTFAEIDSSGLTYSAFDSQNQTWAQIENV